ncbi:putative uncharacterized protein [Waddlia chondrophila 2032/99]|uniref:Peptidase C14 caspase domain-containing protein n=2 Tax=Waddlia chondrophila TaxID=71667 RepID=D6YU20_WADCW|nr:caspase family protein [Waddlia chondrophila]ADI37631.1 hypothetical protein wcw_0256 [Waddlia chondrophila WSU 86-1044]CCB90622.1 putative uncharacterized protein [Waddlia chondrophila 2032/99]
MKIVKFAFILIFCAAATIRLEAATLHTILVGDTMDESIGDSTVMDLFKMRRQMEKVAKYSGMEHHQVKISGYEVLADNILGALDLLQCGEDDVVVFYYSGHGYRTESKEGNPWPNLYFSIESKGIDLSHIRDLLEAKNPRFLIVIADVCNSFVPDEFAPPLMQKFWSCSAIEEIAAANYRSLFLETSGTLMISSSEVGEYSWGTMKGGLFTVAFLQNLEKTAESDSYPEWELILDKTAQAISDVQHPQWDLNLRIGSKEDS